jgi:hypothetical protein
LPDLYDNSAASPPAVATVAVSARFTLRSPELRADNRTSAT